VNPTITLKEMRRRVAEKLFGDDWVNDLLDEEYELLRDYGPKLEDVHCFDGTTIQLNHIKPVPRSARSKIDRAIGRRVRMDAQVTTVDTWLQKQGFFDALKNGVLDSSWQLAERSLFNKLLRAGFPKEKPADASSRRPGPKPIVGRRVIGDMRNDLDTGKFTLDQLMDMKEESLALTYHANRETCRLARESFNEAAKTIPTISD
jgi:hypothetical protein